MVNYSVDVASTATSGSDYTTLSGSVTILADSLGRHHPGVLNNAIVEGTETVTLNLTSLGAHDPDITLDATDRDATANITDDDTATVTIAKINDGAETDTPTDGLFRVSLSQVSSTDTVVNYSVDVASTATSGSDYTTLSGSVTILAGQTSADIILPVLNDAIVEGTETVTLNLTSLGAHDPDITLGATGQSATVEHHR